MALFGIKKNKLWIWKAYDSSRGRLIEWECGDRSKNTLNKLWKRISHIKTDVYCTDSWEAYSKILPKDRLLQSKEFTDAIERNNCRQRTWFARFQRKTLAFSRSKEMVDLTIGLFSKFHMEGQLQKLIEELLSILNQLNPQYSLFT